MQFGLAYKIRAHREKRPEKNLKQYFTEDQEKEREGPQIHSITLPALGSMKCGDGMPFFQKV